MELVMKKIILFALLGILPNFLMSACKKANGANLAGRTDTDIEISDNDSENDPSNDTSNNLTSIETSDNDSKNGTSNKTGNDFGSDYKNNRLSAQEREKRIRQEIENETYGPNLHCITQGWGGIHFWYKSEKDPYVSGDCALYALIRFLHHVEQLYPSNPDFKGLWKISNQELRNRLANMSGHEVARRPQEWLDFDQLLLLIRDLLGKHVDWDNVEWVVNSDAATQTAFIPIIN
jgi:hypothetical protein